jgi:glyoxylase-like metal-dependent hydrolase (beta-lactamase superfamily II)
MIIRYIALSMVCSVACAAPVAAQQVEQLTPAVSVLIGKSGNVLILSGPGGALLVDDQRETDAEETMAAVRQANTELARYVVDTHWHLDHSGGNGPLAATGAIIIAQRNVRTRRATEQFMSAYNRRIPAGAPEALPTVVFDEALDIHHGGETVELRHAANAHTDGDTIVRLRQANVLHLGDLFFNGYFPFIDRDSGGSIQGLIAAVDRALEMSNDATRIVPGHGAIATRAELRAYRDMLQTVAENVRIGIAAGRSRKEMVESDVLAIYSSGRGGNAAGFVGAIYDSLAAQGAK